MNDEKALTIIYDIFKTIFKEDVSFTIDEVLEKFAFDLYLPIPVCDAITGEVTWTDTKGQDLYMTSKNMESYDEKSGWMLEKRDLNSLDDILSIWKSINYTTTERIQDSINVYKSDTIYSCQDVYQSTNCDGCKEIVFCDSCGNSEYLLACQRSGSSNFCIRVDDSINCSNSYNVIFSNKINNSFFIQDCFNLHDCMFCSHIAGCSYCIANMQYTKEEYLFYKKKIIEWILNS